MRGPAQQARDAGEPDLAARAWVLTDLKSGDFLARGDVSGLVDASPDVEREVELVDHPPLSARAGTKLGRVIVRVDGEEVGKTQLVARRGYQKPSLGQRLWYTVGGIFQ